MKRLLSYIIILLLFSCNSDKKFLDILELENKLGGQWIAKAFDGELHEKWKLNKDGWMMQEGYYIAHQDTSYSAISKIEKVGKEIILISVIKNSNPKIFKAISHTDDKIVFENDDYKNPYMVTYHFLDNSNYERTIVGKENDSLVTYVFNFKKSN